MPTYEYACKECGEHLEVVQSFRDDALTECPNCGGPLRKVFGAIGIAFKGTGFYRTDSRSSGSRSRTQSERAGDTKDSSKDSASKDTGSSGSAGGPSSSPSSSAGSGDSKAAAST